MPLPPDTHIAYARLQVRDLDRALAFYRDALGLRAIDRTGDTARLSATGTAPFLIELIAVPNAIAKPSRSTGLYHVAIRLPDRATLAHTFYRLVSLGVPFQGFADHLVSEALYLPDPDGNGLELYHDRPRDQWRFDGAQVAMSSDPLDVETLLAEGASGKWDGIDTRTDIGHVHLHVGDLARAEAFYVDALGMDVMQRSYPGALFVAAGGYHHHLGLNIWAGRNVPSPPANAVGLRAYGIHIPAAADWQAAVERLRASGTAVSESSDGGWRIALAHDGQGNAVEVVTRG
ncbi:MAG: VOC family protein [Chloroflexota bacterium]|nr:VOC family protein [Chloroflexota bacterium]